MSFQIKDFPSISASILNYAKAVQTRITDFSIGSIARTMLEAPAVEIEELYQQMFIGLREAIPVAIYNTFDFSRLVAVPSTGIIRVTITPSANNITISAGATFTSASYSLSFVSAVDVIITAGNSTADITVTAKTPGAVGNVVAGTSFTVLPGVLNIVSALALSNFETGSDTETDAQRKARFSSYILTISKGTVSALTYGLSLVKIKDANGNITEQVLKSAIIEPWKADVNQPIALVNCYIHNGVDGASSELIALAQDIIYGYVDDNGVIVPGWSAAGVHVVIAEATTVSINIACALTIAAGYVVADVRLDVQSAMANYLSDLAIGGDVIRAELIAAAMGVDGVTNITLSTPASDTSIAATEKALVGTYTPS